MRNIGFVMASRMLVEERKLVRFMYRTIVDGVFLREKRISNM